MMTDGSPDKPTSAPRWMRITLLLSLAANLLVLGVVVSAALFGGGPDRRMGRDVAAAPFVMALSKEDRKALFRQFHEDGPGSLRENRRLIRDRFDALLVALRSESFDRAAVERIMAEQKEAATARQSVGERLLIDRLEAMSPDERAAYADRLEQSLKRGPKR